MQAIKLTLVLLFILIGAMAFGQDVEIEEVELDAQTALVVCAAAYITADDPESASWYSTIAEDDEAVAFFVNLFALGLESEEITSDDVADAVDGCAKIKAGVNLEEG